MQVIPKDQGFCSHKKSYLDYHLFCHYLKFATLI